MGVCEAGAVPRLVACISFFFSSSCLGCGCTWHQVFRDYEDASYASLRTRISALEAKTAGGPALGSVLEALLKKIYKRSL